jgi:hypothetical protein
MEAKVAYMEALAAQLIWEQKQATSDLLYRAKQAQIDAESIKAQLIWQRKQAQIDIVSKF